MTSSQLQYVSYQAESQSIMQILSCIPLKTITTVEARMEPPKCYIKERMNTCFWKIKIPTFANCTTHKSIKSSSDKVRCVFFNCLLLNLDFIYAACLEIKKQKEEFKKKQPKQSALYKQCIVLFSFPSCHITAQLYLLGCLFSIAKQKGLRGSVPLVTCARH